MTMTNTDLVRLHSTSIEKLKRLAQAQALRHSRNEELLGGFRRALTYLDGTEDLFYAGVCGAVGEISLTSNGEGGSLSLQGVPYPVLRRILELLEMDQVVS